MDETTTARDLLAEALLDADRLALGHGVEATAEWYADAILASSALDAIVAERVAALADDEAVQDAVATHTPDLVALAADGVSDGEHLYCVACGVLPPEEQSRGALHVLRALAAALTDRGADQ